MGRALAIPTELPEPKSSGPGDGRPRRARWELLDGPLGRGLLLGRATRPSRQLSLEARADRRRVPPSLAVLVHALWLQPLCGLRLADHGASMRLAPTAYPPPRR